ncbi:hypothetical protein H2198_007112 [Neophaeococcomyces mojaviensis]|uniref:Uncharacterized protein n=1 Tax=Neophaeococcomyces mojaviensis TaxID=3383035 RepID=A0ACC3A0W9_9EURO|nr:hypothetical protein H2198_007112 [Knufia sp. JES_112]
MSNRRVKSLAYDDDDDGLDYDDGYDEGYDEGQGELSAEDKEQLRLGTVKVKQALGTTYQVPDADIQDALWNYYYDIGKTVTFIKNKHKPKQSLQHTPESALIRGNRSVRYQPPPSVKGFFDDCPWLQIPPHRKAEILVEPVHTVRGLLGGASKDPKMSKLAALAAKRRQKESAGPPAATKSSADAPQDEYAANLSKLSLSSDTAKDRGKKAKEQGGLPAASNEDADEAGEENEPPAELGSIEEEPVVARTQPSEFAVTFLNTPRTPYQTTTLSFNVLTGDNQAFDFKDPSPDDIVYKAQTGRTPNKAAQPKPIAKVQPKTNLTNGITSGLDNLAVSETTKLKSKNLDVLAEYKKVKHKNAANFVVIGHVDAGKSTLMGRLLFDLKAIDSRTMEKYKKEAEQIGKGSFAFAWVLDQGTEERERGVTIDIATNKFETEKTSFTILDAPGHQDFVPNMIAGASQADFAVLVLDASPGNFESGLRGQTREHALLAKSIGVRHLIVAVNKMDTVAWSQERFETVKTQTASFLKATRFDLDTTAFIPCSGLQGDNILNRTTHPAATWYTGETLVQALDAFEPVTHNLDRPLRMTIADVFRGGVQNPLSISGRIEAGSLQVGDQVLIQPSGEKAYINRLDLDNDDGEEVHEWAVAGQNVVLHLTDIDAIHIRSGDVVCSPTKSPIQNISRFTAQILAFNHLTPMTVDIHRGRLHVPGRISQLIGVLDKKTAEITKKKPKIVQPEQVVRVVVELERGVPIETGGRVVLRSGGETVAAGLVE